MRSLEHCQKIFWRGFFFYNWLSLASRRNRVRGPGGSWRRAGALEQHRGRGSSPNEQRQPRHFPQRHTKTAAAIAGHQGAGTCTPLRLASLCVALMKRIISFAPRKEVRAPAQLYPSFSPEQPEYVFSPQVPCLFPMNAAITLIITPFDAPIVFCWSLKKENPRNYIRNTKTLFLIQRYHT